MGGRGGEASLIAGLSGVVRGFAVRACASRQRPEEVDDCIQDAILNALRYVRTRPVDVQRFAFIGAARRETSVHYWSRFRGEGARVDAAVTLEDGTEVEGMDAHDFGPGVLQRSVAGERLRALVASLPAKHRCTLQVVYGLGPHAPLTVVEAARRGLDLRELLRNVDEALQYLRAHYALELGSIRGQMYGEGC